MPSQGWNAFDMRRLDAALYDRRRSVRPPQEDARRAEDAITDVENVVGRVRRTRRDPRRIISRSTWWAAAR